MMTLENRFVEFIPENLQDGVLYISLEYNAVLHNCVCGCGNKVSTPLSPNGWKLIYNGESVSLYPSIGNWNYQCRSHYWISDGKIEWARSWDDKEVEQNRKNLKRSKSSSTWFESFYNNLKSLLT